MKNKSFEYIVIVFMILFSIILFGIYLIIEIYNKNNSYTLFLKPFDIIECTKWKCESKKEELSKYNNKKFKIYLDGNYAGENDLYYNTRNEKFYVFNDNDDNIYNDEVLLASTGRVNITQRPLNKNNITLDELSLISSSSKLDLKLSDISLNEKIEIDFDKDNDTEKLIALNSFIDEENQNISILAYIDGKKVTILDKRVNDNIQDTTVVNIANVIDIYEDDKLEFIYNVSFFDNLGNCNIIYRLKGKKFVPINECKLND